MAISFVGSAVGSSSPTADTVLTLPGGMAVDDLILVIGCVGDTADNGLAAPTEGGYTDVLGASDLYSNDVNDVNLDLFYKFHNGTDTTITFAAAGGSNASNVGVCLVFHGVKLVADGGPFDTAPVTQTGINTSNTSPPTIDHSGAAGIWVVVAGATGHTGGATASYTAPTGYSTAVFRAHNDTIDCLAGMAYNTTPADPENPDFFAASTIGTAADNAWAAVTMALAPAAEVVVSWNNTPIFRPRRGNY